VTPERPDAACEFYICLHVSSTCICVYVTHIYIGLLRVRLRWLVVCESFLICVSHVSYLSFLRCWRGRRSPLAFT
jgi:hypothetical protein